MEDAIKKALEGGWNDNWYFSHFSGDDVVCGDIRKDDENNPCYYKNKNEILLDPLFWQALGKQQGWSDPDQKVDDWPLTLTFGAWKDNLPVTYWHKLIDHIAEGKSIDDFFATIIK